MILKCKHQHDKWEIFTHYIKKHRQKLYTVPVNQSLSDFFFLFEAYLYICLTGALLWGEWVQNFLARKFDQGCSQQTYQPSSLGNFLLVNLFPVRQDASTNILIFSSYNWWKGSCFSSSFQASFFTWWIIALIYCF